MKIHTKLIIDIAGSQVLADEWFDYSGPVALAKGGGTTTSSTSQNVPTSQQQALQQLGTQYLAPAFGSTATVNEEGKTSVTPPTLSFQPLSGIRDTTFGQLQNTIPLLQQQTQQVSQLPGQLAAFQPQTSPDFGFARDLISQSIPNLSAANAFVQSGASPTVQEQLAQLFATQGSTIPGGTAAQNLVFSGASPTAQEQLARLFATQGAMVPGGEAAQNLAFSGAGQTPQEALATSLATKGLVPELDVARQAALTNLGNVPTEALSAARQELARLQQPSSLYNDLATRELLQIRPGLAARGVAGSGVGQGIENEALQNLNVQLALREAEQRRQAIAQLGGLEQAVAASQRAGIEQLGGLEAGAAGRFSTAAGQLGGLGHTEAARQLAAAQTAGTLGSNLANQLLRSSAQLGGLGQVEAARQLAAGQAANNIGLSLANQLLQSGAQLSNLGQQQAGRQIAAGSQLGRLGLGASGQQLSIAQAMQALPLAQEQLYGSQLGRNIAQSQAVAQLVGQAQQDIARGYQVPLDILQAAVQTEAAPMELLTRLLSASSGGTQLSTGRTIGGGTGIFGK